MNRIMKVCDRLKQEKRKAFIPYFTAGYPFIDKSLNLFRSIEKGGGDIIEIGVLFFDPLADGPVIQYSSQIALRNGTKLKDVFELVTLICKESQTSVVLLVYYKPIFTVGKKSFSAITVKMESMD